MVVLGGLAVSDERGTPVSDLASWPSAKLTNPKPLETKCEAVPKRARI